MDQDKKIELFSTIGALSAATGYIAVRLYQTKKMERRHAENLRLIENLTTRLQFPTPPADAWTH